MAAVTPPGQPHFQVAAAYCGVRKASLCSADSVGRKGTSYGHALNLCNNVLVMPLGVEILVSSLLTGGGV